MSIPADTREAQSGPENVYRHGCSAGGVVEEQLVVGGTVDSPVTQGHKGFLETHPHGSLAEVGIGFGSSCKYNSGWVEGVCVREWVRWWVEGVMAEMGIGLGTS